MRLFRRRTNRICVVFKKYGLVPVAEKLDDTPIFVGEPPQRIGDFSIVDVEGHRRIVVLSVAENGRLYLLDQGDAK